MAAILTKGSRILSIGINRYKSNPNQKLRLSEEGNFFGKCRIHAEIDCILRAPYNQIKGSTLYIARRIANGRIGLAKPCYVCLDFISQAELSKAVYTLTANNFTDKIWFNSINIY